MTQLQTPNVPVIELRHVDKHYGDLHVLKDISLSVQKGEVVVIEESFGVRVIEIVQ